MEPLNYVKQCTEYYEKLLRVSTVTDYKGLKLLITVLATAKKAIKFINPVNGKILDDNLKGLPDKLNLPFDSIVVEFPVKFTEGEIKNTQETGGDIITKTIVIANQFEEDKIDMYFLLFSKNMNEWIFYPVTARVRLEQYSENIHGLNFKNNNYVDSNNNIIITEFTNFNGTNTYDEKRYPSLYDGARVQLHHPISAVLELIEALSCSNVKTSPLSVRKVNKSSKKKGTVSPFDTYHILTVTGREGCTEDSEGTESTDKSRREHLRRGHIRRYKTGLKIWIQSCIISAGVGGVVTKDYVMKK